MKNVAATSGQSVIFAALFFVDGIAWEGICAGSDKVLNFFSFALLCVTLALFSSEQAHRSKNTSSARACNKKMRPNQNIFRTHHRIFVLLVALLCSNFPSRVKLCPLLRTHSHPGDFLNEASSVLCPFPVRRTRFHYSRALLSRRTSYFSPTHLPRCSFHSSRSSRPADLSRRPI